MTEARALATCPGCDGQGWIVGEQIVWVCCRQVLASGECCAAIYGIDRLVPEPAPADVTCPRCGGYGEIEA